MYKKRAFTLIEIMVTLTVFSIIITAIIGMYINSQRTKQRVDAMTVAQQAARTAVDYMIKDIRAAGYNIDLDEDATSTPQRRLVYASPYEIIFNANISPNIDNPENPLSPMAMKPGLNQPANMPTPSKWYTTGAETIIYTLDYNNDGAINSTDRNSFEARMTKNPNDYALIKMVFGYDTLTNTNGGTRQIVSVVGGPDKFPAQTTGTPMFQLWYEPVEGTDSLVLWGDANGDSVLSQAEANALTGVVNADLLDKIKKITVCITGVSSFKEDGEYMESQIKTDVAITRNASINVQTIIGHVYSDNGDSMFAGGDTGIPGVKVRLSSGEMTYTDADGVWSFALISGDYSATCTPPVGFSPVTDMYFDFRIGDEDIICSLETDYKDYFGLETTPTATIFGLAYVDMNGDSLFNEGVDTVAGGVKVNVWNNAAVSIDDPSDANFGQYMLTVNANESLYVWATAPEGYSPIRIDTFIDGYGAALSDPVDYLDIFGTNDFGIKIPQDNAKAVAIGIVAATGDPPGVKVLYPNGGEILTKGETYVIEFKAWDPENQPLLKYMISFSTDAGVTWNNIVTVPYPFQPADSIYSFGWTVPNDSTVTASSQCKIRVGVQDEGNWTIFDESDYFFKIEDVGGNKLLYFTADIADSVLDETVFLYSIGTSAENVLARYLSDIQTRQPKTGVDSFYISGASGVRPFYDEYSKYLEFITPQNIPHADTIFPGVWKLYFNGNCMDEEDQYKYLQFEVHRRDSTGDTLSDTLLFSTVTNSAWVIYRSPFMNSETSIETQIDVPWGFSIDQTDRLYVKLFWSGVSNATGGQDESDKIWIYYGDATQDNSRLILPHE